MTALARGIEADWRKREAVPCVAREPDPKDAPLSERDLITDSIASYTAAISALRMLSVVRGDVLPRLEEPLDIMILAGLGDASGPRSTRGVAAPEAPAGLRPSGDDRLSQEGAS